MNRCLQRCLVAMSASIDPVTLDQLPKKEAEGDALGARPVHHRVARDAENACAAGVDRHGHRVERLEPDLQKEIAQVHRLLCSVAECHELALHGGLCSE